MICVQYEQNGLRDGQKEKVVLKMKIGKLKTNHMITPLGNITGSPVFSWIVEESTGKRQKCARVLVSDDEKMENILFDSGQREDIQSVAYSVNLGLKPRTRYYWEIQVWADDGDMGIEKSWFETGKASEPWSAVWIQAPFKEHPVLCRNLEICKEVKSARWYLCGLGLYEAYVNGEKVGRYFLTPGYTAYEKQIPCQTFDVTASLRHGVNTLSVLLGKGWYMGRYGFGEEVDCIYGDCMQLLAELHITYADGSTDIVKTDNGWKCRISPVLDANLYDGESYDARLEGNVGWQPAEPAAAPKGEMIDGMAPLVVVARELEPMELLYTPKGEWVLDFGQVVAGWSCFESCLAEGEKVSLAYGELLQDACFYQGNLRTAKATFTYVSNGKTRHVRPHFTYYGFRYVKVTGMTPEQIKKAGFKACVLCTELEETGTLRTSNEKVNRLIDNVLWSQRGNMLEIPTDCPQRDERMGWTGDAQIFCQTACYHMDMAAFYRKYLTDMRLEQIDRGGSVSFVVPDALTMRAEKTQKSPWEAIPVFHGSCGWGDAATVIPWTLYQFYGDRALLSEQFENMRLWTEFIIREDKEKCGDSHIWSSGFHFADWLALDNANKQSPFGATPAAYVATAWYYYSVCLTMKAAAVLGLDADRERYAEQGEKIKQAFRKAYFLEDGCCSVATQTAQILALAFGLAPDKKIIIKKLRELIAQNGNHLDTGFLGTPLLCPVLSENEAHETAIDLLLNEEYPGWLYEVNMGATTIWERWNSILPNGHVSDTGMNSMNHYAYGSIAGWMWKYLAGLYPMEPGFQKAVIGSHQTRRFAWVRAEFASAAGTYRCKWEWQHDKLCWSLQIPFNAKARFLLPKEASIRMNGQELEETVLKQGYIELGCGTYWLEVTDYTAHRLNWQCNPTKSLP